MGLLRIASALHPKGYVVHVDGLAAVGLLYDRSKIRRDLGPDLQERSPERFRMLAGKLDKVETYYRDFASDDLITGDNIESFRQLRHCYLRLLIARQHLSSPQSADDELKIRAALEILERELQSGRLNTATRQSKEATLEITRKRLAVLDKREESLVEIDSDLGRIEAQFDLAVESALIRAKPGEIRFDLDFASRMIVTAESFDLSSLDYTTDDYGASTAKPLAQ